MAARVAVTSIVRHAGPAERSGFLRVLDLEARRVVSETPLPESAFRAIDPNPRGGYRGAKGIGVAGGRLAVANSERGFVFDRSWRAPAGLTPPLLGPVPDPPGRGDPRWGPMPKLGPRPPPRRGRQ